MWCHTGRQPIEHLPVSMDGLELVNGDPAPKWKECETCIHIASTEAEAATKATSEVDISDSSTTDDIVDVRCPGCPDAITVDQHLKM
jgi:hypothetical protein